MNTNKTASTAHRYHYRPLWSNPDPREASKLNFDIPDTLLAEVDFKWLMAGEGCWIDAAKFQEDAAYRMRLLQAALGSPSSALRECASVLLERLGTMASCEAANQTPSSLSA